MHVSDGGVPRLASEVAGRVREFFRGLSLFATASAFLLLCLAFDSRTALSDRTQLLIVAALIAVGSNAALWASTGFPDVE